MPKPSQGKLECRRTHQYLLPNHTGHSRPEAPAARRGVGRIPKGQPLLDLYKRLPT